MTFLGRLLCRHGRHKLGPFLRLYGDQSGTVSHATYESRCTRKGCGYVEHYTHLALPFLFIER
jgi:hypothetical protein